MTERISIRTLIERCRSREQTTATDSDLPKPLRDSAVLWDSLGLRLGERLSSEFTTTVGIDVGLSITSMTAFRQSTRYPGLLVPLGSIDKDPIFRFPDSSGRTFADLLLRNSPDNTDGSTEVSESDGLIVRQIAEIVTELMFEAFGLSFTIPAAIMPSTRWPLAPPPTGNRLLVDFKTTIGGIETPGFQILFPDTLARFFADLLTGAGGSLSPKAVCLDVSGVLSRWWTDPDALSALAPGVSVLLPGATLEEITLEVDGSPGAVPTSIGLAELGTVRGRHALKVSTLIDDA